MELSLQFTSRICENMKEQISYLETVILEKGFASDKDVETAARLYGIPMLHKKYRNIAKTLNKVGRSL